ncbi:MAG TPA: hypothetical protein VK421_13075 [Pyrinomonadaceae bacterium]|nr:hypothetical protein [Pyrinomonadaceae bacterium]
MTLTHGSGAARRGLISLLLAVAAFSVVAKAQSVEAKAQEVQAAIEVVSLSPPRVKVSGRRIAPATAWSFRNAHAGVLGLAERIENLSLADEQGSAVPARKLAPGEYEAARPATRFAYDVRLDPPADNNSAAHVSWLTPSHGLLMTGDLLPLPHGRARLHLIPPSGWKGTDPPVTALGTFGVADTEAAVFLIGPDVRAQRATIRGSELTLAFAGDWAFEDKEAVEVITQIFNEHGRSFGGAPRGGSTVIIAPHPRPSAPSQWSAEARGQTVTLLIGRAPTRLSALARLTAPLTHEIFHLWAPNGLGLSGDYAWFYEGFAVYQALRVGVRLGHLNFNDYLDALARTYDGYRREAARDDVSLIEASSRRWSGSNALLYQKGALVAFLYDLELRRRTGGKRTLDDALRELYQRGSNSAQGDGNTAATKALDAALGGGANFTQRYVGSVHKIDLAEELRPYGLTVGAGPARARITVSEPLTGAQRALLRQIGYN